MASPGELRRYRLEIQPLEPIRIGSGIEGNLQLLYRAQTVNTSPRAIVIDGKVLIKIQNIQFRTAPLIPFTTIKGLLRSITEDIAATLYARESCGDLSSIPRLLAKHHHEPTLGELKVRREFGKMRGIGPQYLLLGDPVHGDTFYQSSSETWSLGCRIVDKTGKERLVTSSEVCECMKKHNLLNCLPLKGVDGPIDWDYEYFASRYCPICILYGSQFQAGAIRPTDAIVAEDSTIVVSTRPHATLSRDTLTVRKRKFFYEEIVEPGITFTATINILYPVLEPVELTGGRCPRPGDNQCEVLRDLFRHSLNEAEKLWKLTLDYINRIENVHIGSGKSRGLGLARINIKEI